MPLQIRFHSLLDTTAFYVLIHLRESLFSHTRQ